jgi:nucleoside transporter
LSDATAGLEMSVPPAARGRTPGGRLFVLSLMLFLQHAVLGTWVPLLQLHLQDLHFSGTQIGSLYATLAIASIIAPWLGGQLADRLLPAQWVMFFSHLCGAVLLWRVAAAARYETILLLMFLNAMAHMPTLALSNLIVFRHLRDRDREFGRVRLWGTASWVVMAVVLGVWLSKPAWLPGAQRAETADSLRLGALVSAILALFSLMLPATPPENGGRRSHLAALGALRMLRDRSCAVLMLVSFLLALGIPFAYPFGGLFLRSLGVSDAGVAPWMSLGQIGEIVTFLVLAVSLQRLGFKATFLIGVASWAVRFGIWSLGGPWPLVVVAISLNGLCYAFVFGLGQMFVDRRSDPDTRASAQSLHQVVTFGIGMWLGNVIGGAALDFFKRALPDGTMVTDFTQFYFWPALGAAVCFVIFATLFKTPTLRAARPVLPPDLPI